MKKVIKGRTYDTEKASLLGEDSFEYPGNFRHWRECLYQKRSGEFFLYGYGGPLTQYARSVGQNEWESGEKISPLSYDAAQSWAEEHLDGDEYEKIFGEIEESGEKSTITLSISTSSWEVAKRGASKLDISLSAYIEKLIEADR